MEHKLPKFESFYEAATKVIPLKHDDVLTRIRQQIEPLDWHKELGKEESAKITLLQMRHVLIKKLVDIIESNHYTVGWKLPHLYTYNGEYWKVIEDEFFAKFLSELALKAGISEEHAKDFKYAGELLKAFQFNVPITIAGPEDENIKINLQNGTLEFIDGVPDLREFRKEDFFTYQLPFEFDPKAECLKFQKWLDWAQPKDSQKTLAEFMGYCFTKNGQMKLEKVLFNIGSGANGKSVFYTIMSMVFGVDNITSFPIKDLTYDFKYARCKIEHKLLNYCPDDSTGMDPIAFKTLASGEPVDAREIQRPNRNIYDYAKLCVNANHLPKDVEHSDGYFRRFLIVYWLSKVTEDQMDVNLAKKIAADELPGIFNWILVGLKRLTSMDKPKFTISEESKEAVKNLAHESDSASMFFEELGYERSETIWKPLKELYQEYTQYCKENGSQPLKSTNLKDRLAAKYDVPFKKMRVGVVMGITSTLKTEEIEVPF